MRTSIAVVVSAAAFAYPTAALATNPSTVTYDPVTRTTVFKVGAAPGTS
jgi:hypothetical protein